MVYPKVKVREQAPEEEDKVDVGGDRSSLMVLKVLESLPLKDYSSPTPGTENQNVSTPSVARIPKSYFPSFTTPSVSSSKGPLKNEKHIEEEDSRANIRASSVPRPRAVLSSPDNDGIIGHINQLTSDKPSVLKKNGSGPTTVLKKNGSGPTTSAPSKINPRCVKANCSVNTRREIKEPTAKKTCLKSPDHTIAKQKACLRKVKASSHEIWTSR